MRYQVAFDVAAQSDLADIYDYLEPRAGARVAQQYVDAIVDYCAGFETFPERGTRQPHHPGLRTVGFRRRATIAFRIKGGIVTIMRVFHAGQNVELPKED